MPWQVTGLAQLQGNLPQAFVHAGMLECAVTMAGDAKLCGV
jgi:hypothetical protein